MLLMLAVVPLAVFGGLTGLAIWRKWRWWLSVLFGAITIWALVSAAFLHMLRVPSALPTDRILASNAGRVLDVGAGSGRLAIGVLLARPGVRVTALDIYTGHFGIEDNTPERLMANARVAGATEELGDAASRQLSGNVPAGDVQA